MSAAHGVDLARRRFTRWAVATTVGHLLGALVWGMPAVWLVRSPGEIAGPASGVVMFALTLLAAALQGGLLGLAQAWVLRDVLPIRPRAWALATSTGVVGAWFVLVVAAPTVEPFVSGRASLALVATLGGAAFGALVGAAQVAILARVVTEVSGWLAAHILGWAVALAVTAVVMSSVGPELVEIVLGAGVAAALAGAALGVSTAAALVRVLS